jgi:hypothetical protein
MTLKKGSDITEVKLKNGKKMNYFKSADGRHVFLGDVVAMNIWMAALLIFILLSSMLIGFYQLSMTAEMGNAILARLDQMDQCNYHLQELPREPSYIEDIGP